MSDVPISNRDKLLPSIRPYLEVFGLERLETSPQSIYCYDSDFVLSYFNPAWVSFGLENGHSQQAMEDLLGSNVRENWPATMTKRFMDVFTAVLNMQRYQKRRHPASGTYAIVRIFIVSTQWTFYRYGQSWLAVSEPSCRRKTSRKEVHDLPKKLSGQYRLHYAVPTAPKSDIRSTNNSGTLSWSILKIQSSKLLTACAALVSKTICC